MCPSIQMPGMPARHSLSLGRALFAELTGRGELLASWMSSSVSSCAVRQPSFPIQRPVASLPHELFKAFLALSASVLMISTKAFYEERCLLAAASPDSATGWPSSWLRLVKERAKDRWRSVKGRQ